MAIQPTDFNRWLRSEIARKRAHDMARVFGPRPPEPPPSDEQPPAAPQVHAGAGAGQRPATPPPDFNANLRALLQDPIR